MPLKPLPADLNCLLKKTTPAEDYLKEKYTDPETQRVIVVVVDKKVNGEIIHYFHEDSAEEIARILAKITVATTERQKGWI